MKAAIATADQEAAGARRRLALARIAAQRQTSALALLDWRHGWQGRRDPEVAEQFAPIVYAALICELEGDLDLSAGERRARAAEETRRLLPGLPAAELHRLDQTPTWLLRLTNREAGEALGFTWEEFEALRLYAIRPDARRQVQLAPADLSEDEFAARRAALNRDLRAERMRRRRRERGAPSAEERQAAAEAWRAELARLAEEHGVSERTIRRRVAAGEITPSCQSRVPQKKSIIGHASLTRPAAQKGGGLMPPPPSSGDQQPGALGVLRHVLAHTGGRPETVVNDLLAATARALRRHGAGASRARPPAAPRPLPTTEPPARARG